MNKLFVRTTFILAILLAQSASATYVKQGWERGDWRGGGWSKSQGFNRFDGIKKFHENFSFTISHNLTETEKAYHWDDIAQAKQQQDGSFPGSLFSRYGLKKKLQDEPWTLFAMPSEHRRFGFLPQYDFTVIRWNLYSSEVVVSEVPVPAAAWLFASALIALRGVTRRG